MITYDCRARQTVTNVCAGDLVYVRGEYVSGTVVPDTSGRLPHLVFKPVYSRLSLDPYRRWTLRGDEDAPEYHLDLGVFHAPTGGTLYLDGGRPSPAFKMNVTHVISSDRVALRATQQFRNSTAAIARPLGATTIWSADDCNVTLSFGAGYSEVVRISIGQEYPLGFCSEVLTETSTTLYFGIDF